ncbi:MAG: hypothetical protein ABJA83_12460 [Burkholderiaceae bacterium]
MEFGFVSLVCDQVRTLLRIRSEREIPAAGAKPPFGAKLYCGDIRMTVQSGMTDVLWRWLLEQGWREVVVRPDRRRYKDIPTTYVTHLIDATGDEQRARMMAIAIANAQYRPTMTRDGRIVPVRPQREKSDRDA